MTILLIIAAIIIVVIAVSFCKLKRAKQVAMASNPIDGIRFGGVMGFMLGDSYSFCRSRFKHLDLTINENGFESDSYKMGISSSMNQYVVWGKNEFNNINEVSFCFQDKVLTSISIDIDYTKEGKNDMYGILVSRLSRILGLEPFICTKDFSKWASNRGNVTLTIYPKNEIFSVGERVVIQILPNI